MKVQKLDLLVSLYVFCIMVAEVMGSKTFPLLSTGSIHLTASVAIFVMPLLFTVNDVITEVYGPERTRSVIRSGLLMIFLVMLASVFFTWLPPSKRFEPTEGAYDAIFGLSARISAASLVAFMLAEFLDVAVFVRLKKMMGKHALWFRNNVSNFAAQLVDTTVFMTLAFYAFGAPVGENLVFLAGLIVPYWLLKCAMSVIETPLVYLGIRWLEKD